jgi:hypothetical protein
LICSRAVLTRATRLGTNRPDDVVTATQITIDGVTTPSSIPTGTVINP